MKKIVLLILLLSSFQYHARAQRCSRPFKIVVIGSSTSAGAGPTVSDSAYVNRYRKFLVDSVNAGCTVVNIAVGGATTYKMQPNGYTPPSNRSGFPVDTAKNITKAISLAPDGIIINFPSNDAGSSFTFQEQKDNFIRVMAKADSAGIPVWITTTQPRNFTDTARQNNLIRMRDWLNTTYGPDYNIDFWTGMADAVGNILPAYNSGDGVHMNNAAHRILNDRVKQRKIHTAICSKLLSVPQTTQVTDARFFPNPVTDQLQINLAYTADYIRCNVYDVTGRKMQTTISAPGGRQQYTVSGFGQLAPGSYYVEVLTDKQRTGSMISKTP
jgi:lysophospholipase L1-like esterase